MGRSFAKKGLLLSPNLAQMYTTGEIAANIALETPGLDTLDILVFWKGFPTYASTQTIFTILKANWYYMEQNKFVEWDVVARADVVVPGQHETALAVPWGGTAHPVWFRNDPRVANCKAMGGVFARPVMEGVVATTQMVEEKIKPLPLDQQEQQLGKIAATLQASMPPRENPRINTSVDSVYASGPLGRKHVVIHGNCNYKQTGMLQAYAATHLTAAAPEARRLRLRLPGFRASRSCSATAQLRARHGSRSSPCTSRSVVGEAVLRVTRPAWGATMRLIDYLDKGASLGPDAPCLTMEEATSPMARSSSSPIASRAALQPIGDRARRESRDPLRQRSGRVRLRFRHLARGRRLVSDQSAQRGCGEPLSARRFRLPRC